jgi:protein SCO1
MFSRRQLMFGLGAAALGALQSAHAAPDKPVPAKRKKKMFDADYFGDIRLLTQDGKRVHFYQDLIENKIVVLNMMYATCDGICPTTTSNLKRVHTLLGDRVGRDIHMYSMTLRPAEDTPAVLKDYTEMHGANWTFLTGVPVDIEALRYKLGFYDVDAAVDSNRAAHTAMLRIGNDAYDRWLMAAALGDPEQIMTTINLVDRTPGRAARKTSVAASV